jgi:hypothetical protein
VVAQDVNHTLTTLFETCPGSRLSETSRPRARVHDRGEVGKDVVGPHLGVGEIVPAMSAGENEDRREAGASPACDVRGEVVTDDRDAAAVRN